MTKIIVCTLCGKTMDSDECVKHGIEVHNHQMAKVIQEKLEEVEIMIGKKLKPSDIIIYTLYELMQLLLDQSWEIRSKDR